MNESNPHNHEFDSELEPLDAFEAEWTRKLAEHDPELTRTGPAFTQRVLEQHTTAHPLGTIAGRITQRVAMPYAAAAGLASAAVLGWVVLTAAPGNDTATQPDSLANIAPQPPIDEPVSNTNPTAYAPTPKVKLGQLIANAQRTATTPATSLTAVVRETADPPRFRDLLDWMDSPVPDLKELLAPLEPSNAQSRA